MGFLLELGPATCLSTLFPLGTLIKLLDDYVQFTDESRDEFGFVSGCVVPNSTGMFHHTWL